MRDRLKPTEPYPPDAPVTTRCPVCREPAPRGGDGFPFCSARCRSIDLGRWLDEGYRISRPIEQADLEA